MKNVSDLYPLSPMQELMLVHDLSWPDSRILFNQVVYTLSGALDDVLYERCWNELIQRHPMLRTLFLWEGLKSPMQVVRETAALEWQRHDWRTLNPSEQQSCLDALLAEDRHRGFDLNKAPLMRFALCRRADDVYSLVWSSHHLILDRWCIGILMSETARLYEAAQKGVPAQLEARRPYRDYIRWLQEQEPGAAAQFWRGQLAGSTRSGRNDTGIDAAMHHEQRRISTPMTASLRRFAAQHRLTLSTVVLGAWALLHNHPGNPKDCLLGVTISGRPPTLPGVEGIIGPFINNVPLRVGFPADQPLAAWLQELQDRQQAVQTYGYLSPPQIDELSEAPGSGALFDTLFLYQAPVKIPAFDVQVQLESSTLHTNLPLTLAVEDGQDGLLLWMTYNADRYTQPVILQWLEHMERVLEMFGSVPDSTPVGVQNALRSTVPASPLTFGFAEDTPATPTKTHLPPRNGLEARLFNLWSGVLGHQDFGIQDHFFDLGASSLQAVQLISRMRQTFERDLPVATLFQATTVEQLAQLLAEDTPVQPWTSLVPIKPSGRKAPFFLVHHGGGILFGYAELARCLDPDRPLYGLQEPGIENGQQLPASVEEIAGLYVREIQSVQPHGPYYVGGFCFGGVVAFEMAQQLQRQGEPVDLVVLLDALLPGYAPDPSARERLAAHQARMAGRSTLGKLAYVGYRIVRRARWEVERRYIKARIVAEHLVFDLLERFERPVPSYLRQRRLLELNGHLSNDYAPQPYAGRAILIRATYSDMYYGPDFGWNAVIQPQIEVYVVNSSDHMEMLTEPHLSTLVGHLQAAMSVHEVHTLERDKV